ncbi:MAG: UDP-N-acetylmuramoyl-L-alanyl-D-glutamate--2,6-diaminopimelate ligase [Alphaproteobacteria bacterium]
MININALIAQLPPEATNISHDSRNLEAGDLYIALKGSTHNGADYINAAIEKGASAILFEASPAYQAPHQAAHQAAKDCKFIQVENARLVLSLLARHFASKGKKSQPDRVVAVTGTNGKSSVVEFYRQLFEMQACTTASIGTMGVITHPHHLGNDLPVFHHALTTPDPAELAQILAMLANKDVQCLAMEASSHGLAQYRLDGIKIMAAAFTNLSHDHLDYHGDMETYRAAKYRLFTDILVAGGCMVLQAGSRAEKDLSPLVKQRHLFKLTYALPEDEGDADLKITSYKTLQTGTLVSLSILQDYKFNVFVGLIGRFQLKNMLAAVGLALASGFSPTSIGHYLRGLHAVAGRMEWIGQTQNGGSIFVDYAHTPDALSVVLGDVRPYFKGKLHVVFGCGGNRDQEKRAIMGKIAAQNADHIIITDDNPRDEDPAHIRSMIMTKCKHATEIGDRAKAIRHAISKLGADDCLIVAGKGHETVQISNGKSVPFSDKQIIERALSEEV